MNTTATTTSSTWRTQSQPHLNLAYVITRERATLAPRLHAGVNTPQSPTFFLLQHNLHYQQKQDTILTIPLTIRYLHYLLYNTSLEYSSYTAFTVCLLFFLQLHTYVPSELYNAEQVST